MYLNINNILVKLYWIEGGIKDKLKNVDTDKIDLYVYQDVFHLSIHKSILKKIDFIGKDNEITRIHLIDNDNNIVIIELEDLTYNNIEIN